MKKLLWILVMLAMSNASWGQLLAGDIRIRQTDYLEKSRNQKTGAWILLGGGAALTVIGIVSFKRNFEVMGDSESGLGEAILTGVGVGAMAGSIPLFISSAKNKRRAMDVKAGVKMESGYELVKDRIGTRPFPALSVRIGLK